MSTSYSFRKRGPGRTHKQGAGPSRHRLKLYTGKAFDSYHASDKRMAGALILRAFQTQ